MSTTERDIAQIVAAAVAAEREESERRLVAVREAFARELAAEREAFARELASEREARERELAAEREAFARELAEREARERELAAEREARERELAAEREARERELAAEREASERVKKRLNFLNVLCCMDEQQRFADRYEFMREATLAQFESIPPKKTVSSTKEFISDETCSDYSDTLILPMSKINRRHLAHGRNTMVVRHLIVGNLKERVKRYVMDLEYIDDFDDFLEKECEYVLIFQRTLEWLSENMSSYDELSMQAAYVLYIKGLLASFGAGKEIYSINGIPLETTIAVKRKGKDLEDVQLHGRADCAIGSIGCSPMKTSHLLHNMSVLVELKANTKNRKPPLQGSSSSVGKCTSQQCAEMLALADMRNSAGINNRIVRSILTDFFYLRIAFRIEFTESEPKYLVSSLRGNDIEDFVLLTIFMLLDIDESEFHEILDASVVEIADNDGSDDEELDKKAKGGGNDKDISLAYRIEHSSTTPMKADNDKFGGGGGAAGGGGGGGVEGSCKTARRPLKPLSVRSQNIISMGEDPKEELQREKLQRLLAWEAQLHNPRYLSAENLAKYAK